MVFKVLYQEHGEEAPVREETRAMYVDAESKREVRAKLKDRNINIESVQELSDAHLAYEKKSEDFKIESV
ncbi:DNA-dependent RNA polymerase subunit epsilon [Halalkalibacillus halophilus]|uniref:DNA-dependent RNA polymerase subunit epsilon n=1 Tax=Halalkalibacillus halophilus TaxID=392827 RepID=UPI00041583AA|nr:RNA polymerase epsilon subunit [Halalkalibacillus halophilus]